MPTANAKSGNLNNLFELGDSANLDAFGRLRVSQVLSLNISKFEYSKESHHWPELITGVGSVTHLPNESSNSIAVGATIGDRVIKQSKCYSQYQPGNSQLGMLSGVFGDHESGIKKLTGYCDDLNGVYFKQEDGKYSVGLRSSTSGVAVDTVVDQADWQANTFAIDSEDFENPSKKIIDFSKSFIFFFDLEWLGVGRVRGGFVQDGVIYYCHEFLNAGVNDKVYMKTASLPLRYEVENTGGTNIGSMIQVCSTVKSEGGQRVFGVPHVARRDFYNTIAVPDTSASDQSYTPILSIRPRDLFFGEPFRGNIEPIEFEVFVEGNFPIEFILIHDGDLVKGGGTPVPLLDTDWIELSPDTEEVPSATEYTLAATGITDGHTHNAGFAIASNKGQITLGTDIITAIDLCNGIDITDRSQADTYTIAARAKGGTPTVSGLIRVAEVR